MGADQGGSSLTVWQARRAVGIYYVNWIHYYYMYYISILEWTCTEDTKDFT